MRRCRRHAGAMGVKDGLLLIIVAVLVSGGLFVVGGAVMPRAGDVEKLGESIDRQLDQMSKQIANVENLTKIVRNKVTQQGG